MRVVAAIIILLAGAGCIYEAYSHVERGLSVIPGPSATALKTHQFVVAAVLLLGAAIGYIFIGVLAKQVVREWQAARGRPTLPLSPLGVKVGGFLAGPKLQFFNLLVLFTLVNLVVDYPNALWQVFIVVIIGPVADALISRWRWGEWRVPWPSMVGSLGICLLIDMHGWEAPVLMALLLVGSKHIIRWRGRHLFNPNNFGATFLLLAALIRVGVNDWGAAPEVVGLMLVFGSVSTYRVRRIDVAVFYLLGALAIYTGIALIHNVQSGIGLRLPTDGSGWSFATAWQFAWSPVMIVLGFFALTDPATSPDARLDKLIWCLLIVLIGVPATLANHPEAGVFALFIGAPQRVLVTYVTQRKWPTPPPPPAKKSPAPAPQAAATPAQGGGAQ
ncbi:MAG: hypothetical protein ACYDCK_09415 [Thermoplasmatota archaeon]